MIARKIEEKIDSQDTNFKTSVDLLHIIDSKIILFCSRGERKYQFRELWRVKTCLQSIYTAVYGRFQNLPWQVTAVLITGSHFQ